MIIEAPPNYRAFRAMVVLAVAAAVAVLIAAIVLSGRWDQAFEYCRHLVLGLKHSWES